MRLSRATILILLTAAIFALVACGGSADTPEPTPTVPTIEPTATTVPTMIPAGRRMDLELEGDGPRVLGPVVVNSGVIIVFVRAESENPFSLTFLGGDKGDTKSVESGPGPYRGELVHSVFVGNGDGLAPGEYSLDIEAVGPWRLRLFQEPATTGQSPTVTMAGSGDGGGSWLRLDDGEYTMTTSHAGSGGFTVELFESTGLAPYRIVQTKGGYQGDDRFTVGGGAPGENPQAGFYAMGIKSEGDWQVTITSNEAP